MPNVISLGGGGGGGPPTDANWIQLHPPTPFPTSLTVTLILILSGVTLSLLALLHQFDP
jgi:hypothetical protein